MASGTSWSNILPASDAIYAGTGGIYFMLEGHCAYSSAYDLGNYQLNSTQLNSTQLRPAGP